MATLDSKQKVKPLYHQVKGSQNFSDLSCHRVTLVASELFFRIKWYFSPHSIYLLIIPETTEYEFGKPGVEVVGAGAEVLLW